MSTFNNLPSSFSMPLVFRKTYYGYVNPEDTMFILMEIETLQDRIFEKTHKENEDGSVEDYWELTIAIDVQKILTKRPYSKDEVQEKLKIYELANKLLQAGPETFDTNTKMGDVSTEDGRATWVIIDRKGLMTVDNGVQKLYEELPSGLLQEIPLAPMPATPEEKKLILTGIDN